MLFTAVLLASSLTAAALPSSLAASHHCFSVILQRPAQREVESPRSPTPRRAPSPAPESYRLPPVLRARSARYAHVQYVIYFAGTGLSLAIFAVLWLSGFGVWLGLCCAKASRRLFIQGLIFVPIFWAIVSIIELPLDYYSGFTVEHRFGLSVESLHSWLGDWGKEYVLTVLVAVFLVWIFYRIVRRSPRRWWLYFWLITAPLALALIFVEPYVVEPIFYKFTPLEKTHPALTLRIEKMLHHAGISIPRSRIYEMNASAKTRTLNAYVSGFGRSKRVVIWDNTLRRLTPDETLTVLAHETGHYVLHHVVKEFALDELVALGFFWLGFVAVLHLSKRQSKTLGRADEIASLPLIMLILTAIVFLASPAYCGISRHYEHQADEYGLKLAYGIVPDPNGSMVRAFEILGRDDLADPDPSPFMVFWLFTHPPLNERIRFAAHYKPGGRG